ncbi:MAG: ribonuclease J [Candidatus Nanopelagicales bacterium]
MTNVLSTRSELGPPPPLAPEALRIVALGGLGEIGRNMTVFEFGGRLLIVDCGVLFPEDNQPGVDLILPDFDYIRERLDDIDGVILTHAHEDHIGGLPYLLRERVDIPVYGSKLTLGLIAAKLREHRIKAELREVAEGQIVAINDFEVEFVAVNHSIPDALAVAIKTPAGRVLHTGDFKMDQLPLDGRITDLNAFARLGDDGVDAFLVDSTNAEVAGFVTSEQNIAPVLDEVFARAPGRLVVACFASHIHRVQQVINAAAANGRRVAFVGRSMVRTMGVARDLGYLKVPGGLTVTVDQLDELPDDQVVLVCTGSQGEPMAVLARIANRDHKIRIHDLDTVVLASSVIPGNENSINRVINGLSRWGATVVHTGNALVHVSGHAAAGELLYAYNIVKPRNVMPVHGEVRHLLANAALAVKSGVDPDHVVVADDGTVIDLIDGALTVVGKVPCGYVFVDGSSVGDLSEGMLKDRRILGEEGFVSVFVAVDISAGKVVAGPEVQARGFAEAATVFNDVLPKVTARLEDAMKDGVTDPYQLQQLVRRTIGKWVGEKMRRRPMIVPVVVEA